MGKFKELEDIRKEQEQELVKEQLTYSDKFWYRDVVNWGEYPDHEYQ